MVNKSNSSSLPFIIPKHPISRIVSDLTHSPISGINHPTKKYSLSKYWSAIANPCLADCCQCCLNAEDIFQGDIIYGFRIDIDEAYKRVRIFPPDITLCALLFYIELVPYLFLPLVAEFGLQDSGYYWSIITKTIVSRSHNRANGMYQCQLTTGYTDDFIGFGNIGFVQSEINAITRDSIDLLADVPIHYSVCS